VGEAFSRAHVARICKVSPRRLRSWEGSALVARSGQSGRRPAFAFRDLVSIRSVRGLVEGGVSVRRIRRCVESVRRRMPELEHPVEFLRLWMEGSRRVVVRHGGVLLEPDGQAVLDFAPSGGAVVPLAPRRPEPEFATASALEWFERGCALDSDPARYAEAADAYRRALEIDPDFADAHCNLGAVRFNQDRRGAARACFERALEIDPEHPEAHLNLATLLEEDAAPEAALRHYQAALAVEPSYADAHVSLALLYERLGEARHGRRHWRSYLRLDPGGAWAELARRRLREGFPRPS
jgi:cytochrome c-type biogenesis protein CcmH/NrfG/DNA-binding transcriptional MerR regulator